VHGAIRRPGRSRRTRTRTRNRGFSLDYDNGPIALMLAGEQNTDRDRIGFVGASYAIGAARVMGSFSRIDAWLAARSRGPVRVR